ncbi:CpsD/CapB family tyrosine-protein kinase [Paenibacillus sediminis]|uniref:non-specific protein-tyrosine kinase n=1 Tax=Paenibacillus sediminis TaxID=664909 RepID=A0ABS4H547_9BACL|nr:CpsD/CapB family tyrosine-protein kinase [Paenibacillus sediminis]MBP1937372.1 capsular exopolysaccharide synthesis family protein [Paenibacillus sediminis]
MPRSTNKNNLVTVINPKSPIAEAYRTLRTNIQFSSVDKPMQVIMATSAQMSEGKTTTISNLAVAYAQEGKKVLLIDGDLRKPSLHQVFVQSNHTGLTNVLTNQYSFEDVIRETDVENLYILTSGPIPPNPAEMIGSQKMQGLLKELKELYDVILFDTPPVLSVTDSLIIGSMCDGVILVILAGKVKKSAVLKAKSKLEHVKAHLLGTVLNNLNRKDSQDHFYYYGGNL